MSLEYTNNSTRHDQKSFQTYSLSYSEAVSFDIIIFDHTRALRLLEEAWDISILVTITEDIESLNQH